MDRDHHRRTHILPIRLQGEFAAPDDTHPNVNGSKRLAKTMIDALGWVRI